MNPSDRDASLSSLRRTALWTALRLRIDQTLSRAFLLLPLPLLFAVGALTYIKVARPAADTIQTLAFAGMVPLLVFLIGTAHAWLKARPEHIGALALDRHHGLHDRITSALSFSELPPTERSPLMNAAIEDAVVNEALEAGSKHVAGDTEAALEVIEAAHTAESLADDQHGPPLANDFEGAGDRAFHLGKAGAAHGRTLTRNATGLLAATNRMECRFEHQRVHR